jgi:hypothetical protein
MIDFRKENNLIFRKKTAKSDSKPPGKDDVDTPPSVLAKVSVTSDADEDKEKKKDRELLVK